MHSTSRSEARFILKQTLSFPFRLYSYRYLSFGLQSSTSLDVSIIQSRSARYPQSSQAHAPQMQFEFQPTLDTYNQMTLARHCPAVPRSLHWPEWPRPAPADTTWSAPPHASWHDLHQPAPWRASQPRRIHLHGDLNNCYLCYRR